MLPFKYLPKPFLQICSGSWIKNMAVLFLYKKWSRHIQATLWKANTDRRKNPYIPTTSSTILHVPLDNMDNASVHYFRRNTKNHEQSTYGNSCNTAYPTNTNADRDKTGNPYLLEQTKWTPFLASLAFTDMLYLGFLTASLKPCTSKGWGSSLKHVTCLTGPTTLYPSVAETTLKAWSYYRKTPLYRPIDREEQAATRI